MYIGAHIGGGIKNISKSLIIVHQYGCNIVQLFVNPFATLSEARKIKYKRQEGSKYIEFKKLLKEKNMKCVVHASYTINLSRNWDHYSGWIQQFINEIIAAHQIGAIAIVVHMGKQMELELSEAYNNMYTALVYVNDQTRKYNSVRILLETSTGQGSEVCYKIEDLAYFYKKISRNPLISERFGICVDTCHIFAAGYNLVNKSGVNAYLEAFEELIGLRHVKLVHLNDSKKDVGSNVDRHENIGHGFIGKQGLLEFAKYFKNINVPIILETPGEHILDDISMLV